MMVRPKLIGFLLTAALLAGCQTTGSTGTQATGNTNSVPVAEVPRPAPLTHLPEGMLRDTLTQLAPKGARPGPLLLHGGGGGRKSDGSDPFLAVGFYLSAQNTSASASSTICLIEAASPEPKPFSEELGTQGQRFIHLGISPENLGAARRETRVFLAINQCTAFYFAGGDPSRLSVSLLETNGADTPALAAIRRRHAQGAAVFGSSAGAMMASKTMLCECGAGSSFEALTQGRLKLAPGLRFVPNTLIDAHFLERGLIGRLVEAMRVTQEPFALGLDEDTAVLMPGDGSPWMIMGESSAVTVRQTSPTQPYEALEINLLAPGDRYDPKAQRINVAPERQLITASKSEDTIIPEIFEPGGFSTLLRLAALNTYGQSVGLSKIAESADIRLTVTRTPETKVYFSPNLPLDRAYSIIGLRLRINAPITRRGAS